MPANRDSKSTSAAASAAPLNSPKSTTTTTNTKGDGTSKSSSSNAAAATESSGRASSKNSSSIRYHPFFKPFFRETEEKRKVGSDSRNGKKQKGEEAKEEDEEDQVEEFESITSSEDEEGSDLDIDYDGDGDDPEWGKMATANSSILPHGSTVVQPNSLPIPRFFGGGKDPLGRTLDQILSWDDERLERQHNYIQCIFPLPEPSYFAGPDTPVLDESSIAVFHASAEHRAALFRAFERMMSFYGFDVKVESSDITSPMRDADRTVTVSQNAEFEEKAADWLGGHNNMRITRIIRSLRLLGLEPEGMAFYKALDDFREESMRPDANPRIQRRFRIGDSFVYWTRAAQRPLFIPPDASDERADRMIMARAQARQRVQATFVNDEK